MNGQMNVSTPEEYIEAIEEPRKSMIIKLDKLIRETLPDFEPHIRSGMIGYGTYHYEYASGKKGEWFKVGLASNKNYISTYICGVMEDGYIAESYKERLGKVNCGRSCIRFKRLDDIDLEALKEALLQCLECDWSN